MGYFRPPGMQHQTGYLANGLEIFKDEFLNVSVTRFDGMRQLLQALSGEIVQKETVELVRSDAE